MAEGQDTGIEQRLRQAYREERRWYNIRGASRLTLWLIALLAVAFLIDWGLFAKTQMSGITGLTTPDGRVTIMMPHPERVTRAVTNSWRPAEWTQDGAWLRLFRNARVWLG